MATDYVRGLPYIKWFKEQIEKNAPWDKMVTTMLTADGKMWDDLEESGRAATGYLLRDSGMPLDNLANTLTVFLGTDVACAQCHDHPFSDWTQRQFYEMAAFFGATTTRYNGGRWQHDAMMAPQATSWTKPLRSSRAAAAVDVRQLRNQLGTAHRRQPLRGERPGQEQHQAAPRLQVQGWRPR